MRNISVIGADSFLAGKIIAELKPDRNNALTLYYPFDRKGPGTRIYHFPDHPLNKKEIDFLAQQEAIIFCAAAGVQPGMKEETGLIYDLNLSEPVRLINELKKKNFTGDLVTFGSCFEIGKNNREICYDEEALVFHQNPVTDDYSLSKHLLTSFIYRITAHPGLSFRVKHLVLANVYGSGENPDRLIPYLVRSVKEGQPIKLSSGIQKRQYTHVNDVARNLAALLQADYSGILNFGDDQVIRVRDLALRVIAAAESFFGTKSTPVFGAVNTRDQESLYLGLDTSRAEQKSFWQTFISLETGIHEYLKNAG